MTDSAYLSYREVKLEEEFSLENFTLHEAYDFCPVKSLAENFSKIGLVLIRSSTTEKVSHSNV